MPDCPPLGVTNYRDSPLRGNATGAEGANRATRCRHAGVSRRARPPPRGHRSSRRRRRRPPGGRGAAASATSASRRERGRRVRAERRHRHHPAQVEVLGGGDRVRERGTSAGAAPPRPSSTGSVARSTCTSATTAGARRPPLPGRGRRTRRAPVDRVHDVGVRRHRARLVASGAARRSASQVAHPGVARTPRPSPAASWSRFSPMSRTPRAARWPTSSAGNVLVTATRVTSARSRPASAQAAAIRSSTPRQVGGDLGPARRWSGRQSVGGRHAGSQTTPANRPVTPSRRWEKRSAVSMVQVSSSARSRTPAATSWASTRARQVQPRRTVAGRARPRPARRRRPRPAARRAPRSSGRTPPDRTCARPVRDVGRPARASPRPGTDDAGQRHPCGPAWATAEHRAVRPRRGQQHGHAVGDQHDQAETRGRVVTSASASGGPAGRAPRAVDDRHVVAVHLPHEGEPPGPGRARAASRRRFSATAAGSSPTWSPRFSASYGARLTPPCRSVTA